MGSTFELYAKAEANQADLKRRYPRQFDGRDTGLWWPDGWHLLVEGVCLELAEAGLETRWVQIKEKFGGLRMYCEAAPPRIDVISPAGCDEIGSPNMPGTAGQIGAVTARAEAASHQTCMKCGDPGLSKSVDGWIVTLCTQDLAAYKTHLKSRGR